MRRISPIDSRRVEEHDSSLALGGPTIANCEHHRFTKTSIGIVVGLYERWGKPDLADEWRAKLETDRAEEAGEISTSGSSNGLEGAKSGWD